MSSVLFNVLEITQAEDEEVGIRCYLTFSVIGNLNRTFKVTRLLFDTYPKPTSPPYVNGKSLWVRHNVPVERGRPLTEFRSGGYDITITTNEKEEPIVKVGCGHRQPNFRLRQVHVELS